jgi:hypothetical protein
MTTRTMAKRKIISCLAAIAGLMACELGTGRPASALMARMTVEELGQRAVLIARGRVTAVEGRWSRDRSAIYSEVTLSVSSLAKAPSLASAADGGLRNDGRELVFRVPGGTVSGVSMTSSNDRVPVVGEEVIAFLTSGRSSAGMADAVEAEQGSLTIAGHEQGLFAVRSGQVVADGQAMTADALMTNGAVALR